MSYLTFLLAALSLLLSGCTSTIRTEATVFHRWPPASESRVFSFSVTPEQAQSLEYQAYERMIQAQMEKIGLRKAEANAAAPMEVAFSTSVTSRDVLVIETVLIDSFYGTRWYGPGFSSRRPMWPSMPVAREQERRYTVFQRQLTLKITDTRSQQRVYEITVRSDGEGSSLATVMPYLVESAFKDFPGQNGRTRIIELKIKGD